MVILPLFSTVFSAFYSRALQSAQARKGRESDRKTSEREREREERESLERESKAQTPLFTIAIFVRFQRTPFEFFWIFWETGRFVNIIWVLSISIFFFWLSVFSPQILFCFCFLRFWIGFSKLSRNSASWVCVFPRKRFSFS